jgi:hypothetical protein
MGRLLVAVVVVGFTVYCLIDVLRSDRRHVRDLPRAAWVVLILLLPVLGGILWLVAGRPRSGGGGGRGGRPRHVGTPPSPRPARGPDDDPDFLRGLDRRLRDERSDRPKQHGGGPGGDRRDPGRDRRGEGGGQQDRPGGEPGTGGDSGDPGGRGTGAGGTDRR